MKKQMRKNILKARMSLDHRQVEEKSAMICEKILNLAEFKKAQTVMAYLPIRNEVDVKPLFRFLWAEGKRLVIPVCDPPNIAIIPSEIIDLADDLEPGTWGILEPKKDKMRPVSPRDIDCVIIPGVAFDPACNRLGYGGGYYDRFLPKLRENTPKIAVAFQVQIVPELVPDVYDIPMDMVITEENGYCR
ncbi:MAG: 5-formyltetrahydrofolate cyclo-ligase [Bacillota bacterium]|jgi:5-formyltetrahydrofolate cyclo-ligase